MKSKRARALIFFTLLCISGCQSVHSDKAVKSTMENYIKALKNGDGKAFVNLHSKVNRQNFPEEIMSKGLPPRTDIDDFKVDDIVLRKKTAGIFGHMVKNGKPETDEEALFLVLEDGEWKIDHQKGANEPQNRAAFVPPDSGKFMDGGMKWPAIAPGHKPYQIQATIDESFLYIRVLYHKPIPEINAALSGDPPRPPDVNPRKLLITDTQKNASHEVVLDSTVKTRFSNGKNTFVLGYSLSLNDPEFKNVFSTFAGDENQLFAISAKEAVIKIPLETMNAPPYAQLRVKVKE